MVEYSVIVPIYKVEPFLRKCIESVLQQTYGDFELILVDDGSPDNCPAICDEYQQKDSRIKVIHKPNGGLVSARNTGLKAASGKYVCCLDGDDWFDVTLLEKLHNIVQQHNAPDMIVFNMVKLFQDHQETVEFHMPRGYYSKEQLNKEFYPYMMWDCRKSFYKGLLFPSAGGKVISREILLQHYCKDERIGMGEDNAFIFECAYAAKDMYFLPEGLYIYNQLNEGSFANRYDHRRLENNRYLVDYITENLGGADPDIDRQINTFKAYWLVMAVFHEVKCKRPLFAAAKHLKQDIKKYRALEDITVSQLPKAAKLYLCLLKCRLYVGALLAARVINMLRK